MKKLKPALVFSFLGIATFASLVGTVSGTLAWYAYNARATLSYSGTSVENSVQLQIGLASEQQMPHIDGNQDNVEFWNIMSEEMHTYSRLNANQEEEQYNVYYYFAPLGYGINSSVINAYLRANGYATSELAPTTSGYYNPSDANCDFSIKEGPNRDNPTAHGDAKVSNYLRLQRDFRASNSKTDVSSYVEGAEIWLTDAVGAASSNNDGNVFKAMRIFFNRGAGYTNGFMVNPAAQVAGETRVGGLLDLSGDGYYDFTEDADGTHEILYGEWDTQYYLNDNPTPQDVDMDSFLHEGWTWTDPQSANPYYDLNNTGNPVVKGNTFNARHHVGTKYYDHNSLHNTAGIGEAPNGVPFKTAKYESVSSAKPIRNMTTGILSNPDGKVTSVCKTAGAAGYYIGYVDTYIWLEGWDYNVIDEEQRHSFDLGLTFEINKVS